MSFLPTPARATPSRVTAVRSRSSRCRRKSFIATKSTLSGIPWQHNGTCRVDESAFEQVVHWVVHYGGYVNPCLTMGYSMTTGTRGIVARRDVRERDLEMGPLIAVPDSLRIDSEACRMRLKPIVEMCDLPPLERLSQNLQTGLLLAFEKRKGSESFWGPYIDTLPAAPSCAWLLPEQDLRLELALLPEHVKGEGDYMKLAEILVGSYKQEAMEAMEDYGEALGLEGEDICWALGQVHSRGYGQDVSLIPIVDLINHNASAMPPLGLKSDDDIPMTYVGSFFRGVPRSLRQGDELFVNYQFSKETPPLAIFLEMGFLPQEFMKRSQSMVS